MSVELIFVIVATILIFSTLGLLMLRFFNAGDDRHNLGRNFGDEYWRRINSSDDDKRR